MAEINVCRYYEQLLVRSLKLVFIEPVEEIGTTVSTCGKDRLPGRTDISTVIRRTWCFLLKHFRADGDPGQQTNTTIC